MNLSGRAILITGAAQGIGLATAQLCAALDANVILLDRSEEQLDAALTSFDSSKAMKIAGSVTDRAFVKQAVAEAAARFGGIHGLVNNAGITRTAMIDKMTADDWQAVIDVNLTGVFLCTREVAAKMIELGNNGAIINISSISRAGNVGQTNYSAAKAGVAAATVTWAKELARYGIRVAGIAPGFIETEMTLGMKPEALEKMTAGIPLKRMGKPEEIAHSAAYIFENDYYTGRILEMDGGLRV